MADAPKARPKRQEITDQEALNFHSRGRPGKIEIVATKPMATQRDLALAYSPGVAVPVKAIHKDPATAFDYTARGNMVAASGMPSPSVSSGVGGEGWPSGTGAGCAPPVGRAQSAVAPREIRPREAFVAGSASALPGWLATAIVRPC